MTILNFIQGMINLKREVTILAVGNLVTVSVAGRFEPDYTVPCSSCEKADEISSALDDYYANSLK